MPRQWLQRGPLFAERQPRPKPDPLDEEPEPILFESSGRLRIEWTYSESGKLIVTPTRLIWSPEGREPLVIRLSSVSKCGRQKFWAHVPEAGNGPGRRAPIGLRRWWLVRRRNRRPPVRGTFGPHTSESEWFRAVAGPAAYSRASFRSAVASYLDHRHGRTCSHR